MRTIVLLANVLLAAIGVSGAIWNGARERLVLEVLACLGLLSVVGICSVVAIATESRIPSTIAVALNRLALVLVSLLLLLAFVVSPGSGAAALPVLGAIAAIHILTLNEVGRTSRSTRSRVKRAPG